MDERMQEGTGWWQAVRNRRERGGSGNEMEWDAETYSSGRLKPRRWTATVADLKNTQRHANTVGTHAHTKLIQKYNACNMCTVNQTLTR